MPTGHVLTWCVAGNIPAVQHNFTLVVLAIVAVSVLPVIYEVIQARKGDAQDDGGEPSKTET